MLALARISMTATPHKTGKTTGLSTDEEDSNNATEAAPFSPTKNPSSVPHNPSEAMNLPAQTVIDTFASLNPNAELVKNAALLGYALAQEQQRKQQALQTQLAALSVLPHLQNAFPPGLAPSPGSLATAAAASNQLALSSLLSAASQASKISPTSTPYAISPNPAQNIAMLHPPPVAMAPSAAVSVPNMPPAYFDASTIPDPKQDSLTKLAGKKPRRGGGASEPFPQKLYRMLTDLEKQDGGSDIAAFLPHGRAFAIRNPKKFVAEIMPKYFRMSRFSSFQRQLNLYDFKRITEGRDKGAYYHELFLQGRPALCTQMRRTKIKGTASWIGRGGFHEEVNFYSMPPIQPEVHQKKGKEDDASSDKSGSKSS